MTELALSLSVCMTHIHEQRRTHQATPWGRVGLRGVKGSHHIYTHPEQGGNISVPHPKKDLGTGLVQKLMKQSGLKGRKA